MPGTLLSKLFKLITGKPAVPWVRSLLPVISITTHSHLVQTLGTQQRLTPPLLPLSCLAPSPCASSLRGLGWVLEQHISGSSGPGQQPLGSLPAAEPHSCVWPESGLEARAWGALPPSAVLPSRVPHSRPLSMRLPCTPVLSVQSAPQPGLSPGPYPDLQPVEPAPPRWRSGQTRLCPAEGGNCRRALRQSARSPTTSV